MPLTYRNSFNTRLVLVSEKRFGVNMNKEADLFTKANVLMLLGFSRFLNGSTVEMSTSPPGFLGEAKLLFEMIVCA